MRGSSGPVVGDGNGVNGRQRAAGGVVGDEVEVEQQSQKMVEAALAKVEDE